MVQLLTGHSKLKSFLHTIKVTNDAIYDRAYRSRILQTLYLQMFEIHLKLVVEALLLHQPFDLHMITKNDLLYEGVKEYVQKSKRFDCYGISVYMINFHRIKILRLKCRFQVRLLNFVFATTHFSLRMPQNFISVKI